MEVVKTREDLTAAISLRKNAGDTVGFVPTMGALHAGHISLLREAKAKNGIVVCSIFVNPAQFNDKGDLDKYPRPLEMDTGLLEKAGCDILFLPDETDIYPHGTNQETTEKLALKEFNYGDLENVLEGAARPDHFAGVALVVSILLKAVQPDSLFLGQKDYQQYIILKKLVAFMNLQTEVIRCPIVREENGLAMSSRNIRLSSELRSRAGVIYKTLQYAASLISILSAEEIQRIGQGAIHSLDDFTVDYFEIRDADDLHPINETTKEIVMVTVVIAGGVRLLDNITVVK